MKILLHDNMPAYLCHGGMQVHAKKMHDALQAVGVDVEYARWWDPAQKCDLIHQIGCSPSMVRIAHEAGVKIIITNILQNLTSSSPAKRLVHRVRNQIILHAMPHKLACLFPWHNLSDNDALVYVNRAEAETAIRIYGVPYEKTHVIPHGCDRSTMVCLQAGPRNSQSYLLSIASIVPRKNSVLLAQLAKRTGVPVVFLGKPFSENDAYFTAFRRLVDEKYVIYPGFVTEDEKLKLMSGASGFVLPSRAESGCLAVYEAAAAGLPLLLSDKPWAYTYEDPHSAIQHVELNDEKAFADRLKSFFETSQRLEGPTFPVMSWEEIAKEYVNVYERVLSD